MGKKKEKTVHSGDEMNTANVGRIKKIYLENFLTYTRCDFIPGKNLNLIIGPNGTGKSSIVSAIVLVFGGDVKLLGRNTQIGAYVRNGFENSVIQAFVYGKRIGEIVQFERSFTVDGDSTYKLNGNVVSKGIYLKEVGSFNIQIGNLCQFLPQDKVQDFAKMNAQEMLLNTMTSVCSQEVKDTFLKLQEMRKLQLHGGSDLTVLKKKLRESETKLSELSEIIKTYIIRNEYIEKINVCKAKKLSLQMIEINEKIQEANADLTEAKKSLAKFVKEYEKCYMMQKRINTTSSDLSAHAEKTKHTETKIIEQNNNILKKIDEITNKISQEKIDFQRNIDELATKKKEIEERERLLNLKRVDYENLKKSLESDDNSAVTSEIEALNVQLSGVNRKRLDINNTIDNDCIPKINWLNSAIQNCENNNKRKEEYFQNYLPDVFKAIEWIDNNRHLFQGKVYKPVMLEISVAESENAMFFEHIIPNRDFQAITCENKSDLSFIVNELTVKQKLSINVCYSAPADKCRYTAATPISELKAYGFKSYMLDLIHGPPAILNHLCSLFSIHNIPVGTDLVHKNTDSIPSNIRKYFGSNYFYSVSYSNYSNQSATTKTPVKCKKILSTLNNQEIKDLKNRLLQVTKKTDDLRNKRTEIESNIQELNVTRTELKSKQQKLTNLKAVLDSQEDSLNILQRKIDLMKESSSSEAELEQSFAKAISGYIADLTILMKDKIKHSNLLVVANSDKIKSFEKLRIYNGEKENISSNVSGAEKNKIDAQSIVTKILDRIGQFKRECSNKEKGIMTLTNNHNPNDVNYAHKSFFDTLPNTLDGVNTEIGEIGARVDCMEDVDQEKIKEHEEREIEVNKLKNEIQINSDQLQNIDSEIKNIYNDWVPKISEVISQINNTFGQFMSNMQYVGEVLLSKKSDFDFDTYGITILVQYRRNASLQALDKRVQSGGERAVATATYTLALQQLTHVPFRCVDEINQGMDANNERKIFEMIVDETTQPGRPQYFLVTPKLLPKLNCNDKMVVHVICNGSIDADTFSGAF